VQTSEKRYTTFRLEVRNAGGHSSVPSSDNAIYHLAAGLTRLANHEFPLALNEATRIWLERSSAFEAPAMAADMRAVASGQAGPDAVRRLSAVPAYNAQLRTTCVATMLDAGHAENALPQLAAATVNCRILPGGSPQAVQATLTEVLADPTIAVTAVATDVDSPPSSKHEELFPAIEALTKEFWPGIPVIPVMSTGATDSRFLRNAGIPSYGHTGIQVDVADVRAHGRDERVSVDAFHTGVEYLYRLVRLLATAP
jgi:acetylornithine deacetylase/succinyl-diaminopimelate desuccinylase-like protein